MAVQDGEARAAAWRSMLYVPANVRRFVEKAPGSGADAVILDLEDSVPADAKEAARSQLADAVAACRQGPPDVLVRINRALPLAVRDVEAAVAAGVDGLLVTKVLGPEHIQLVAEMVEGLGRPLALVPLVESAAAAQRMDAIAAASPLVTGMLVGAEDLAAECGCTANDELIVMIKRRMVLAARAAGIAPLGTLASVADYRNPDGVREAALAARRSGFVGASCVHPSLVAVLNEAFSPTDAEVELARRQLAAAAEAIRTGRGSFGVDGRMVDEPILRRARQIVAAAERQTHRQSQRQE